MTSLGLPSLREEAARLNEEATRLDEEATRLDGEAFRLDDLMEKLRDQKAMVSREQKKLRDQREKISAKMAEISRKMPVIHGDSSCLPPLQTFPPPPQTFPRPRGSFQAPEEKPAPGPGDICFHKLCGCRRPAVDGRCEGLAYVFKERLLSKAPENFGCEGKFCNECKQPGTREFKNDQMCYGALLVVSHDERPIRSCYCKKVNLANCRWSNTGKPVLSVPETKCNEIDCPCEGNAFAATIKQDTDENGDEILLWTASCGRKRKAGKKIFA